MDDGCSESDDCGAVTRGSSSEEIPWALTIFSRHLGPTISPSSTLHHGPPRATAAAANGPPTGTEEVRAVESDIYNGYI